jgi:outer membrane protein insertion porin family
MKNLLGRCALIVALLLGWAPATWAQPAPAPVVQKVTIQHVGPPATSDELIRANLRVKPGDPYSRAAVDEDIRTLYGTGYFFNIRVGEERSAPGVKPEGMVLTYVVQGKPRLTDIQFSGNKKYSRSRLLKKITSKISEPLDERKLFADTQAILKYYQKNGFQKTQVKYSINIDENAGRGTATFEILESPKVKIKDVIFEGAQAFKQAQLRKVIKTHRRWMFSWITGSGVLKDDVFEEDKEKLADFYRNEGYIDFELKDVKYDLLNPKWMNVRFVISEGRQYKVGAVSFKGNALFTAEQILQGAKKTSLTGPAQASTPPKEEGGGKPSKTSSRGLPMKEGQIFTPRGLYDDIEAIHDYYGSRGYIGKGEATHIRVEATRIPNTDRGTMDLVFEIEEGEKSYVEKIEIQGNHKTRDKVIRRELAISPGEAFDLVRVKRSQSRLEQMQYFDKVETKVVPADAPNHKNLVVGVEEANTANFMVGAGFSTVDSIVGYVEVTQANFDLFNPPYFTGGGQRFRIYCLLGTERQDYMIDFVEPWFLGRKLQLSVDLFHRELSYWSDYYNLRQSGGTVGLAKALGFENLIGKVSYTLEDMGVIDVAADAPPSIKEEEGYALISKMGLDLVYDTSNHATLPDRGQRSSATFNLAGGPFGGDKDFYKWELDTAWYFRGLARGHIFKVVAKTGIIESYGDTVDVPFYERYFLGGAYSMRGFRFLHAGADDTYEGGEPVGGNTMWFAFAEYSIPIIERVRIAAFYDIGNVYHNAYDYNFGEFLDDVGLGLLLNLPIGALRFDYGIPLHWGKYTGDTGRFNFSVQTKY